MSTTGSQLSVGHVLDEGSRRAGHDIDERAPWIPALELLVQSAASEGGMHEAGAAAFQAKLVELVDERLRAEAMLAANPEARARPMPVRFVVAGLARSGTTLLHRLLACDPDVDFLPTWQAFRPVPPSSGDDGRRAETVARIEAMRRADPDALRVHPLDADAPEEEVFLLQHSFASMLFALPCPLPSYNEWLNHRDHTEAYEFVLDLLRLDDWHAQRPAGRPRVMKSPQFVLDLGVVERLLPDAVVAQNHRDPVDLVGSYCSTYARSRARSCAHIDPIALGQERLRQLATMAERSLAVRHAAEARGEGGRFVDVQYARLVREPIAVVEELYAAAGLDLSGTVRDAMARWLADGVHRYRITGTRRDECYLSFTVYAGSPGHPERVARNVNHLELGAAPGDRYELVIEPPDNACYVIARQYFHAPGAEAPATMHIEVLDGPAPVVADDHASAARWRAAAGFVRAMTRPPAARPQPSYASAEVNRIGEPAGWREDEGGGRGTPDQTYALGRFDLDADHALVMDVRVPPCAYASAVLWNRFGQSIDSRVHRSTINDRQMVTDADGWARIVVAHRDPGVPNWLDTGGRRQGTVFWRFLLAEERPEPIRSELVPLSQLSP